MVVKMMVFIDFVWGISDMPNKCPSIYNTRVECIWLHFIALHTNFSDVFFAIEISIPKLKNDT